MASDKLTISNQTDPIKTGKQTLAFYPNIKPASKYKFGSLIEGKVKVWLYDFSQGKENGFLVTHNLDIKDCMHLANAAKKTGFFNPFSSSKIFGEPLAEGKYAGMCQMTQIKIVRYDKDTNGKPRNYPWLITVSNGYGRKLKNKDGGFYAQKGSVVMDKEATISLTDNDFLYEMTQIESYLDAYRGYVSSAFLPNWLQEMNQHKENGYKSNAYTADRKQQTPPATSYASTPAPTAPAKPKTVEKPAPQKQEAAPKTPSSPAPKKYLQKAIVFNQDEKFVKDGSFWKIKAMTAGKAFWLFFNDVPNEALIEKRTNAVPFRANLLLKDNNVWFHSFA